MEYEIREVIEHRSLTNFFPYRRYASDGISDGLYDSIPETVKYYQIWYRVSSDRPWHQMYVVSPTRSQAEQIIMLQGDADGPPELKKNEYDYLNKPMETYE